MTWQQGKRGECLKSFETLFSVDSAPTVHRRHEQYFQRTPKKSSLVQPPGGRVKHTYKRNNNVTLN